MANEALINLLEWCKRERENLQCQLDALKAGRFKTHSNDGSGWKDTTQDSIERVEENIWELSAVNTLISRLSEPVSSSARWVRLRPVLASTQGEVAGEAAPTRFDCE